MSAAGMEVHAMTLMKWPDLLSRPRPHASARIAYGPEPSQVADLWLPAGRGRHPLVVMIHGGCWTKHIADLTIMDWAADDLRRRSFAVWNIEYRGVDEAGGGYPGTFQDVAAGIDAVRGQAAAHRLKLDRVVVIGHSAGGHLALWAAARRKLPASSPLYTKDPLPVRAVVDLAGIADLKTDIEPDSPAQTACGGEPALAMAGPTSPTRPDAFADTSPMALLPLGVPTVVLHGAEDTTVPAALGAAYAEAARAKGDTVTVLTPLGGHVEEIAPGSAAWAAAVSEIERLVKAP
jgi:acetyl esterase/lipase